MFDETLSLAHERPSPEYYKARFKGRWGLSLVDVFAVDLPTTSENDLQFRKKVWSELGSNCWTVRLLATGFHPKLMLPVFVAEFSKCSLQQFYHDYVHPSVMARHIIQITQGTSYLHDKNIVHRNLTPGTISVMTDENVKLSDFQMAINLDNEQIIVSQEPFGLAMYKDFEANLYSTYGKHSDVFSLGCIYFEMLTGMPFLLFSSETIGDIPAYDFYGRIVELNSCFPTHEAATVEKSNLLEERLKELKNSAIQGCKDDQMEFLRSMLVTSRSLRPSANSLLEKNFCQYLVDNYDTSDSQKWTPEFVPNSGQKSFKISMNPLDVPEELDGFEQIFDCPQSVKLLKQAQSTGSVTELDLHQISSQNAFSDISNATNLSIHARDTSYPQFSSSQIQDEGNDQDDNTTAANEQFGDLIQFPRTSAGGGTQISQNTNYQNSIASLPGTVVDWTLGLNAIGEKCNVQNITFTDQNNAVSPASVLPEDISTATSDQFELIDGNIIMTRRPQQKTRFVQEIRTKNYTLTFMQNESGQANDDELGDREPASTGNGTRMEIVSAPEQILGDENAQSTWSQASPENEHVTPPSRPRKLRSNAANRSTNTRKPGRPKGSYCSYPQIDIVGSASFQCTKCKIIFQDRTKSLRHRTYYLKNERCRER